jgi:hypothetical protein
MCRRTVYRLPMGRNADDPRSTLAPKTITDRFDGLTVGDSFTVNGHDRLFEVVDTSTYSVVAEDADGHRVTVAQNLQTGGWSISEDVHRVEVVETPD